MGARWQIINEPNPQTHGMSGIRLYWKDKAKKESKRDLISFID